MHDCSFIQDVHKYSAVGSAELTTLSSAVASTSVEIRVDGSVTAPAAAATADVEVMFTNRMFSAARNLEDPSQAATHAPFDTLDAEEIRVVSAVDASSVPFGSMYSEYFKRETSAI